MVSQSIPLFMTADGQDAVAQMVQVHLQQWNALGLCLSRVEPTRITELKEDFNNHLCNYKSWFNSSCKAECILHSCILNCSCTGNTRSQQEFWCEICTYGHLRHMDTHCKAGNWKTVWNVLIKQMNLITGWWKDARPYAGCWWPLCTTLNSGVLYIPVHIKT